MPSVTQLELDKKSDRYNYRLTLRLRYTEQAKAVLYYLHSRPCMPFKNGMGYSLSVEGSTLALVTNRCACYNSEHQCLSREMKGDEYRMVCDVFDQSVRNAVQAVNSADWFFTHSVFTPSDLSLLS